MMKASSGEAAPTGPSIRILELTKMLVKFELRGVDLSIANALRRVMIAEVPTMAIHHVTVNGNTSVLHDEYIVHRLGLVPMNSMKSDNYEYVRDCSCSSTGLCTKCSVEFALKVRGNKGRSTDVTSADIRLSADYPVDTFENPMEGARTKMEAVGPAKIYDETGNEEPPILITRLNENQELDLKMVVVKGIGKENSKWSPVATVALQQYPTVDINPNKALSLTPAQKREIVESCPAKVLKYKSESDQIDIEDVARCMLCQECVMKVNALAPEASLGYLTRQ